MKDVGKGPWRSGPPPSVGWWPASTTQRIWLLRWWDGKEWSMAVYCSETAKEAGFIAGISNTDPGEIKWRERADWWPASAEGGK